MQTPISRDHTAELDLKDPIARFREQFLLPAGVIYLDGNSLGPLPATAASRIEQVVRREWGSGLVRSWNDAGWIDLPERVAAKIAPLIGAAADEVMVADSTSVNIFKLLAAALKLRPERRVILSVEENFGTDLYVAEGLAHHLAGDVELRLVPNRDVESALTADVAVLMLTHVDFRSGEMHELKAVTAAAHAAGALVLWDLAHSAGAVEVELDAWEVDFAVGCGYKYLNGGPGAPAFAFVARRHHDVLESPLWGWMGHSAAFDFNPSYDPAPGVKRLRVGTPPVLSLAALECGVETIAAVGVENLREKSIALTELFIALVNQECGGFGFDLASPVEASKRGSQVSFRHEDGYAIVQALISEGVIGDFRAPDILRFGLCPAYIRFVDVWEAVSTLRRIMIDRGWDRPEFRVQARVT